jgi:ArsR family transcriptional regulator
MMAAKKNRLLFEKQAEVAKAIAHPVRIAVVDFLRDGEQCVCDIAEHVEAERSNVSRHLALMVAAGVLEYRRDGLKVIYKLKCPCILDFFDCVGQVLRQNAKENRELLKALR